MSNYNLQYKEYYDNLKKKNSTVSSERSINDDGILMYKGNNIYTQSRRYKKESFFANLIAMQLVGTMMLFLFAFGGKYSSNQDIRQCYTKFKVGVEQEYTYANAKVNSKELKIDSLKNKFLESINWVKDKLVNDDFTY
ncbi:Uncharacterised protein [uncultured Clostridium sp.]|uniref:hypothetical protein n=1 Tax=uncultured Clostridium sp. TaxID=59620 RepID=UPI0008225319|nr:hypothetical protein [uncultured Clostridium sp.]SCJ90205.1 Uncharacterised protein [uncultured Clostridium sp.]